MSRFYIKTQPSEVSQDSEIFSLTVSSTFSLSMSGTPTSHPVENRSSVIDNYISQNDAMSISGVLSDIRNLKLTRGGIPYKNARDALQSLETLKNSKSLFTVHFDDNQPEKKNCLFNTLSFSKDSSTGTGYKVSMSIVQVQISDAATIETFSQLLDTTFSQHSEKSDGGDNSTKTVDGSSKTFFLSGFSGIGSVFSNLSGSNLEGGN